MPLPFIDTFRKLLRRRTGDIDQQVGEDAESAKAHLIKSLDAHTEDIEQGLIAHMEKKVAEQRKRFDQLEPMTFDDATFEEVPAPRLLTNERPHKDQQQEKEEPEARAPATPPPDATDEAAGEPPDEAGENPLPKRATARADRKRPRISGNRAR
jgi:hypothetical protein